ncbi:DUF262 domain-containing protein [Vibrio scophthalmi]|uniref:DUF262 domain-containing protein n=1 Tax=Vibrio scophthalmi TaxID=45658 RepID=UPI003EBCD216
MKELLESIPSTNVKVIELYNKIESGGLIISPDFQRKLVWKKQHKFHFIDTILMNFPFPEVYVASAEMDLDNITASEIVVDGQQRLSTIVDYIKARGDFKTQNRVKRFEELTIDEKKLFLNYLVSVRDLKNMDPDIVKEIFMRINNTEYSLNAIEKLNAQYGDSEFVIFCKQLVDADFKPTSEETDSIVTSELRNKSDEVLEKTKVFSDNDIKRMSNLQYMMTLVATLIESEFFNRNIRVQHYIERYNIGFERKDSVEELLLKAFDVILSLNFEPSSYWNNKSNFFSLVVELTKFDVTTIDISAFKVNLEELENKSKMYFAGIKDEKITPEEVRYFEYAKEAVNEKSARIHRAKIIEDILSSSTCA